MYRYVRPDTTTGPSQRRFEDALMAAVREKHGPQSWVASCAFWDKTMKEQGWRIEPAVAS